MDAETCNIIAVAGDWRTQPGKEEAVHRLLLQVAAAVREYELGNLLYLVHQDSADPAHFLVYEQYASQDALDAHRNSTHYQELIVGKIAPLLARQQVTLLRLLD